ncbi:CD3e molecule, epsilon associated protein [Pristis pectinata]|uniref:CD3e molecule, epsilon associated protein n=1 Tax=Pristis pectinata TaxID=685728 RepID=UPI00223D21B6|nr:CD3e molecule, epsilon associated protein [Pristis pectinata]
MEPPPGAGVRGRARYQSPPEFQACPQAAPRGLRDPSAELWLIKAPAGFQPRSFSGKKIPLVGFDTLRSKTCEDKVYNVFATPGNADDVCLILPSEEEGRTDSYSDFAGCITIDENWEGTGSSCEPCSIPTSPAPGIPLDLKLRFQPFGVGPPGWSPRKQQRAPSSRKRRAREEPANGGLETVHQAADPETQGGSRKRKRSKERQEGVFQASDPETEPKHRKRKKRSKGESHEAVPRESDCRHKKKKKKKDKS